MDRNGFKIFDHLFGSGPKWILTIFGRLRANKTDRGRTTMSKRGNTLGRETWRIKTSLREKNIYYSHVNDGKL